MMTNQQTVQATRLRKSPAYLAIQLAGPVAVGLGSWIYLGLMIDDMGLIPGMPSMMMMSNAYDPVQLFGLFRMWAVMMAAMMLPTAIPMIMAYARMQASDRRSGAGSLPVFMFSGGYVVAWAVFSLAAAIMQAGLTNIALMSPMMMKTASEPLAGGILIVAGLYQLSPAKLSCLRQCRSPVSFLMTQWQDGKWGALIMGWRHGLFCVGCCWALMGLLFVAGVMNTVWIVAIMLYVLVEKVIPGGERLSSILGVSMIGFGLWIIF